MRNPHDIVVAPIITEKSVSLRDSENKYLFKVAIDVNKIEVKHAIEELFNVKVVSVRMIKYKGKKKRMGRFEGKRSDWKKAIVKLEEGERIPELLGGS